MPQSIRHRPEKAKHIRALRQAQQMDVFNMDEPQLDEYLRTNARNSAGIRNVLKLLIQAQSAQLNAGKI